MSVCHFFPQLPCEIRLRIFECALAADQPRIVEVYIKSGEIFSTTPPPPLLHACSESRNVTIRKYKPWLPQFKNYADQDRWRSLIEEFGYDKLSRLQNVW